MQSSTSMYYMHPLLTYTYSLCIIDPRAAKGKTVKTLRLGVGTVVSARSVDSRLLTLPQFTPPPTLRVRSHATFNSPPRACLFVPEDPNDVVCSDSLLPIQIVYQSRVKFFFSRGNWLMCNVSPRSSRGTTIILYEESLVQGD